VLISPAMAQRMGLQNKDVAELELNGKKVEAAVWIQAGHPDNSVTAFLGYGRRRAGRAGTGAGFDMYQIRPSATPWFTNGVNIRKTGGTYLLASTQGYQSIETPNRRQGAGESRPPHALAEGRYVLSRRPGQSQGVLPAGAVHAL